MCKYLFTFSKDCASYISVLVNYSCDTWEILHGVESICGVGRINYFGKKNVWD